MKDLLWYKDIIKKSELAEDSDVKGCMIIKPYGFYIWEKIKKIINKKIKNTGHKNAYFPLFIPKSYIGKELKHVKEFAKECAVVTHYRLKEINKKIEKDPDSELKEELIIRPTSETIIWNSYKKWIKSYKNLPIMINQWANVVRWEMKNKIFLRTTEFLWQEGHTVHSKKIESIKESQIMLNIYKNFLEKYMRIPTITGIKTENEKFAGAEKTYTIEILMKNGKALQAATSHLLGQNFSKAFNVKFVNKKGNIEHPWGTSWGVTTRLIGALIMTHSDENGIILPPVLAPIQVIIIPIYKNKKEYNKIFKKLITVKKILKKINISAKIDNRYTHSPGWKFSEYEIKGVPIRISIGEKEVIKNLIEVTRRDTKEKVLIKIENIKKEIPIILKNIQNDIYEKALKFKNSNIKKINDYNDFKENIKKGGLIIAHWDGTKETEEKIKKETKASIRCIPINLKNEKGKCIYTGNFSKKRVFFAKSY